MLVGSAERRRSPLSRLLLTIALVLLAAALAVLLQRGLQVERVSAVYFVAVVVAAAAFGVWHGLLAAIAATVVFNLASAGPDFRLALGSRQDLVNLVVFVCGAWVAGLYIDEARRERDALARLTRGPVATSNRALGRLVQLAFFTWAPLAEALRVLAAVVLSAATMGIAALVMDSIGSNLVAMIYLAGVVVAASLLGARYALITAILNVVAYDFFVLEPRFTFALDNRTAGVNLIVFLAVGWQVGRFAERVRYERQAVRSLFEAGGSFSATADEPTLRVLIANAVAAITGGRYVAVRDEVGGVVAEAGDRPAGGPPRLSRDMPIPENDGLWLARTLAFQGRALGSVTWLGVDVDPDRPTERTVEGLLDLGAAAIARARMSSDNARLEAIAQAEDFRRALLASVSHDFRTPLAGILGSATSLIDFHDRYDEAVRRDLLSNIREQAYRLNRYVENLLGMSRLESGTLKPKLRPVPLEAFVFETWESIADGFGSVGRPELAVDEAACVLADPVLLRQALTNVLENAVKYSPPGAAVSVASRQADDQVLLCVSDQGPGSTEDDLERLFRPFFRARNSKAGGVGLGLFIARSFLESMGGAINARRRADGRPGMTFELILPAAEVAA